jgi:hypothetical protein
MGQWRWRQKTIALRAALRAAGGPLTVTTYDRRETKALPAPVKRYFELALQDGQAIVTGVSFAPTLVDGSTSVTLEFRFGSDGLIAEVWAASRPRSATGSAPWLCRVSDCEQRGGMQVPLHGEVEWQLPNGPAPYFRCRITAIEHEFAVR